MQQRTQDFPHLLIVLDKFLMNHREESGLLVVIQLCSLRTKSYFCSAGSADDKCMNYWLEREARGRSKWLRSCTMGLLTVSSGVLQPYVGHRRKAAILPLCKTLLLPRLFVISLHRREACRPAGFGAGTSGSVWQLTAVWW